MQQGIDIKVHRQDGTEVKMRPDVLRSDLKLDTVATREG